MMTDVRLRPATEDDDEFLYQLHRRTLGDVIQRTWNTSWDDDVQRDFHRKWFDPDRIEIVLIDDERAGVVDGHFDDEGNYYLGRIEIAPEFQNRGLGTELIHSLIDRARANGAGAVELHVLELNRARKLYERLGFRAIAEEPPKRRMRLELTKQFTMQRDD